MVIVEKETEAKLILEWRMQVFNITRRRTNHCGRHKSGWDESFDLHKCSLRWFLVIRKVGLSVIVIIELLRNKIILRYISKSFLLAPMF